MGEGDTNVLRDMAIYNQLQLQFLYLKVLDVFIVSLSFGAQRQHFE
jgi:hypothetical protein